MGQHRFHHHGMVGEGQGQVNRQAPVCHRLVLAGDCYSDMVPSIIPIWREMLLNPLRPFVIMKNVQSERSRIISHISGRHSSASL